MKNKFKYVDECFADIQMLRYRLNGFEKLTLKQKLYIYYLAKAALVGRDITYDQHCKHNLRVRKTLETVVQEYGDDKESEDYKYLCVYLKQVWFASGIHHHYGSEKFKPLFSESFFCDQVASIGANKLPLAKGESMEMFIKEMCRVIFDDKAFAKRVNKTEGDDLLFTSACNFYQGVSQTEAECYYADISKEEQQHEATLSYGLNSTLVKDLSSGEIREETWHRHGKYGKAITQIIKWLRKADEMAENEEQREVIKSLCDYYESGNLALFNDYCIKWVLQTSGEVDFINGFIEVYCDPIGIKGTWEGLVTYKDKSASERTRIISEHAQWFEDHSPVDIQFRKEQVKGITANVVCAAMLGGDEYPSTAIGINLPNADWIRRDYGSKSITISNITEAYDNASRGNGFYDEFVIDKETVELINKYGVLCDNLHTDLHECLGHGSGKLLEGVSSNALGEYSDIIEEARADLYALYYLGDSIMVELGLLPNSDAHKSQYYLYLMNGAIAQLARLKLGDCIEEAHMRNRAIIARWVLDKEREAECPSAIMINRGGKTYIQINDYKRLRQLFAVLLAKVQRIKSVGDYEAARRLVETYGVKVDHKLHVEVIARYSRLNIAPYKGFINPHMQLVYDEGQIVDVIANYTESYSDQMMRYSKEYGTLI